MLFYPNSRLNLQAELVANINDKENLTKLVDMMYQLMRRKKGIGLAATQVNVQKRLFIMDKLDINDLDTTASDKANIKNKEMHLKQDNINNTISEEEIEQTKNTTLDNQTSAIHAENTTDSNNMLDNINVFINPIILDYSEKTSYKEGCLSVPNIYEDVTRHKNIKLQYIDLAGNTQIQNYSGLAAICIQHEIDHLNGITFVQHLSEMKQYLINQKLSKR